MSVPGTQLTKLQVAERWAKDAKEAFLSVIKDETVWNREVMFAIQALRKNDLLQKCNPISIRTAVTNVAMTGISLNPALQLAYLIPRDGDCCLDFSYRGLIKIMTDSGSVKMIDAHVVYDFDEFEYEQGSDPHVHYRQNLSPAEGWVGSPEQIWKHLRCVCTIATLRDGSKSFCILPKWKVERTARTSKAWGNKKMPWETFADEQIRKTGVKYHYKTLPQTEQASEAIRVLNEHEGLDLKPEGERSRELADRVAQMAKETTGKDPGDGGSPDGRETQGRGSSEGTAGICICPEMEQEGQNVWDCPKHGRVAPGR